MNSLYYHYYYYFLTCISCILISVAFYWLSLYIVIGQQYRSKINNRLWLKDEKKKQWNNTNMKIINRFWSINFSNHISFILISFAFNYISNISSDIILNFIIRWSIVNHSQFLSSISFTLFSVAFYCISSISNDIILNFVIIRWSNVNHY